MRRREFIIGGGTAPGLAGGGGGRQPAMPVIGFINQLSREEYVATVSVFHEGLREQGFVEGRNVVVEYRWANSEYKRLPELASDLVQRGVAVLVATGGDSTALAARS